MVKTGTKGIFQSDVLIRTAVIAALEEMKANPWLLDFVFAWLAHDDLTKTKKHYGEHGIEEAKEWFLNTEISVSMAYRPDRPEFPSINIELLNSNESGANSLGDVSNEGVSEDIDASEILIRPKPVLGPFTPASYDSTTGIVTLPTNLTTENLFSGNMLYDAVSNRGYVIDEVLDESTFTIAKGVTANFTRAFVAPRENFHTVLLESVEFAETYRLRCMVNTTPVHLTYLHSILMFILLRSKEDLLEARGFERTTITSGNIMYVEGKDATERISARDITISGFVRQFWPKRITQKIDGVIGGMKVLEGGQSPASIEQNVVDQGWSMEDDQFAALLK